MDNINEEVVEHSAKIKSLEKRMAKVEEMSKSVNELALSVKEIAVNQTRMLDDMKEEKETRKRNEQRITSLEMKPAEKHEFLWREVIKVVISVVGGALLGAIIALVIKK